MQKAIPVVSFSRDDQLLCLLRLHDVAGPERVYLDLGMVVVIGQKRWIRRTLEQHSYASPRVVSRFGLCIGGALTTCLSSLANFRYPGGFLGRSDFSLSSALAFGSDITPPPSPLERSMSGVFRQWLLGPSKSAQHPWPCARYSETLVHRGI